MVCGMQAIQQLGRSHRSNQVRIKPSDVPREGKSRHVQSVVILTICRWALQQTESTRMPGHTLLRMSIVQRIVCAAQELLHSALTR